MGRLRELGSLRDLGRQNGEGIDLNGLKRRAVHFGHFTTLHTAKAEHLSGRLESVLIDRIAEDFHQLVDSIRPGMGVVALDGGDGVWDQVAHWARSRRGFDAMYIILDAAVPPPADTLRLLAEALASDGKVHLYEDRSTRLPSGTYAPDETPLANWPADVRLSFRRRVLTLTPTEMMTAVARSAGPKVEPTAEKYAVTACAWTAPPHSRPPLRAARLPKFTCTAW